VSKANPNVAAAHDGVLAGSGAMLGFALLTPTYDACHAWGRAVAFALDVQKT